MKTPSDKVSYFDRAGASREGIALLITGLAIVLFSTAGIARMMGWALNSTDDAAGIVAVDPALPVPPAVEARAGSRCPECGVIVSMREIGQLDADTGPNAAMATKAANGDKNRVKAARRYEITVRMADGSNRVIEHSNPATWRNGERLIVIAGTNPSQQ